MSDEELIARLRDVDEVTIGDARVAADRIEALTKELDDYAHKLMQANNTYTEMHLEIEQLSDKLAKAVEALEFYTGYDDGPIARATLAAVSETHKIKGESHD